jgi:ribosome recycling factor
MSTEDFMLDTDDLTRRMEGALASAAHEFASLRTGRASASMSSRSMVDAYGQMTPINQLGTVNVPEPRMVTINVWDKGMVGKVEKAIRESGLGINPQTNGTIIMLPIPELNEQRRRELTKVAAQYAEHARVPSATSAATAWTRSRRPRPRACPRTTRSSGRPRCRI